MRTKTTSFGTYIEKTSGPGFDLYQIKASAAEAPSKELIITAHGAAEAAPIEPEDELYVNTALAARRDQPPSVPTRGLPLNRGGQAGARARPSMLVPAKRTFSPRMPISYFVEHHVSLRSEADSTLRRIVELRALSLETYPPGREQTDYDLYDVSGQGAKYAGIDLPRNDFIKALLFEARFAFDSPGVRELARNTASAHGAYGALTDVPDILMVTGKTRLSAVLAFPLVSQYQRVLGAFCRVVHHAQQPKTRDRVIENKGIPEIVDMRLLETRVIKCMCDINRWPGPVPTTANVTSAAPLPPPKPNANRS